MKKTLLWIQKITKDNPDEYVPETVLDLVEQER